MSAVSSTRKALSRVATRSRAGLAPACSRCNSTSSRSNPLSSSSSTPPPPPTGTSTDGPTTHFGFKTVPQSIKESLVGGVFTAVAPKYDLMNDSMSLGIHRLWKESFVNAMVPRLSPSVHANQQQQQRPGSLTSGSGSGWEDWQPTLKCLDVAGGTGDIALKILDKAREKYGNRDVEVEIVDLNEGMLHEGQKRVAKTVYYNTPQISFTHGNAQSLPTHIQDDSIDIYTIAFGIRNCTSLEAVLKEAHRVLKPGGRLGVLEFGKVQNPLFKEVYKQYSFNFIPLMGQLLAGDRDSYQYLIESIERFPTQVEFARLVQEAGFQTGELKEGKGGAWTDYTNGICTFWRGVKA